MGQANSTTFGLCWLHKKTLSQNFRQLELRMADIIQESILFSPLKSFNMVWKNTSGGFTVLAFVRKLRDRTRGVMGGALDWESGDPGSGQLCHGLPCVPFLLWPLLLHVKLRYWILSSFDIQRIYKEERFSMSLFLDRSS